MAHSYKDEGPAHYSVHDDLTDEEVEAVIEHNCSIDKVRAEGLTKEPKVKILERQRNLLLEAGESVVNILDNLNAGNITGKSMKGQINFEVAMLKRAISEAKKS